MWLVIIFGLLPTSEDPQLLWRSDMGELSLEEDWIIKQPYKQSTVVNDTERGEVMKMESCGCCGHYYTKQGFKCTMATPCLISYYVKGPNAWQGFSNQAPSDKDWEHDPQKDCLAKDGTVNLSFTQSTEHTTHG